MRLYAIFLQFFVFVGFSRGLLAQNVSLTYTEIQEYLQATNLPKHALVIGVEEYIDLPLVTNATSDATLVAEKLRKLGFTVDQVSDNPNKSVIMSRLTDFASRRLSSDPLRPNIVVVYYSGHGFHFGNGNFLVPKDAQRGQLLQYGVPVSTLVEEITQKEVAIAIFFFDACRTTFFEDIENPEYKAFARPVPTHFETIFYGFASQHGKPSLSFANPTDTNSPFAMSLANRIAQENLELNDLFNEIKSDVDDLTDNNQRPQQTQVLSGEFYFKPSSDHSNLLKQKWHVAMFSGKSCAKKYLDKYPGGAYTSSALKWLHNYGDLINENCK